MGVCVCGFFDDDSILLLLLCTSQALLASALSTPFHKLPYTEANQLLQNSGRQFQVKAKVLNAVI